MLFVVCWGGGEAGVCERGGVHGRLLAAIFFGRVAP
jgi:hypothetical protein